jgi:hypothetical protein
MSKELEAANVVAPVERVYSCAINPNFEAQYQQHWRNRGVTCDICLEPVGPGDRWKCQSCPNYDICEKCWAENKQTTHFEGTHQFTKL